MRIAAGVPGDLGNLPEIQRPPPEGSMYAMYALNFYSSLFADSLRQGVKTVTIRLGNKMDKYRDGQVVWITVGRR
ncbi:MAG: hypothetical protein ACRDGN_16630, partial [bacterium]